MEIENSSNYRQTGGGSMIVNIQDFYSFLKKIANSLRSFCEVIAPYHSPSGNNKIPAFHFYQLDRNQIPELNSYKSVGSSNVFFYIIFQKVYWQKNYTIKNPIAQLIISTCVLKNIYQIDFVNII